MVSQFTNGSDVWVLLEQPVPWHILLGEAFELAPVGCVVLATQDELAVNKLAVGERVEFNTNPDKWVGNDGGCLRVTRYLDLKVGVIIGFEPPYYC